MKARLLSIVAILVVAAPGIGAASAGTSKETFVLHQGFNIGARCDGSGLTTPDAPYNPDWTVTFTVKHGTISATVKIKQGFTPDVAVYTIRLVQGPDDCGTGFTEFTLPRGKGKITISEPVTSDFAFVHIDQREVPCCIVNSSLVSDTFRH
jgi:hypothetical protein